MGKNNNQNNNQNEKKIESKWLLEVARREAEEYYIKNGIAITLRGLFYILVSKGYIPNTKYTYRRLSDILAEARYDGKFPPHLIRDETRSSAFLERVELEPEELSEEELKELIKSVLENRSRYNVNPWKDQPKRVIILIEKAALYDLVKKIVEENFEFGVYKIKSTRGYDSATDIIELAEEIKELNKKEYKVVLLILTDFDPSGEDIHRDYIERLKRVDSSLNFEAEKVAVTPDHIKMFDLPCSPDSAEELEKLKRDPRYKGFVDKWGLVRVELDALVALYPEEFKQIVIEAIKKHFDYSIYENVTKKRMEEMKQRAKEVRQKNLEKLKNLKFD
ncbi:MAG: hypothetical protein QW607_12545 [Desulfurococcaceae archaeon]